MAGDLTDLFPRHSFPLLLKRNNAGNMNHPAVNDVPGWIFGLTLDSPPYFVPYKGTSEDAQRETNWCFGE